MNGIAMPSNHETYQRQIAFGDPSADIAQRLSKLNRDQRANLRLGSLLTRVVGDTGAIWRSHNETQAADFDALFSLLLRRPGMPMRFLCDLS